MVTNAPSSNALFCISFTSNRGSYANGNTIIVCVRVLVTDDGLVGRLRRQKLMTRIASRRTLTRQLTRNPVTLCYNFSPATSDLRLKRLIPLLYLGHFRRTNRGPITLMNNTANLVNSPDFGTTRHGLGARRAIRR